MKVYKISYLNKEEKKILVFGLMLFAFIIASYTINRVFAFAAIACIIVYEIISTPFDTLIPFAIIVTWGAEIWEIGNSRLYTIIKLLSLGIFIFKLYLNNIIDIRRTSKFTLLLILFITYIGVGNLIASNYEFGKVINLLICYIIIYVFACNTHWLNLSKITIAYGEGVILSSILSTVSVYIPKLYNVVDSMMKTYNVFGESKLSRMSGMTYDPNLFGLYVIIGVVANLCVVHTKKYKNCLFNVIIALVLTVMGIMTLSKTFIIVISLVGCGFIGVWINSRQISFSKKITIIGILVIVLFILASYTGVYFQAIVSRFSKSNVGGITTGRSTLWRYYIDMLLNKPISLLFGKSLGFTVSGMSSPHNFIVYMLLHFGIFGIGIYISMILSLMKYCWIRSGEKKRFINGTRVIYCLPLLSYFVFSLSIDPFMLYDVKMIMLIICFTLFTTNEYIEEN